MWTKKRRSSSRNMRGFPRILGGRGKKAVQFKKCANFHEFRGETTKKWVFIIKSAKKHFFLTNSRVSDLELRCSHTELVTFFGAQSSLGGHNSCFGGTSSDLEGHGPGLPPVASGLLQVYNLSNCNYRIFVKEILIEIGFIEEMRTI